MELDELNALPAKQRMALCLMKLRDNLLAAPMAEGDANAIRTECHGCAHRREVPGNCHIECVEPDVMMTGSEHGIRNGWFMYPLLFDPVWKTRKCAHFTASTATTVNPAISPAVSHAK